MKINNKPVTFHFLSKLLVAVLLLTLAGCFSNEVISKNYYILEYYPHSEDPELLREEPLDYSLMIQDSRVARTYDRRQLVRREYGPKIQYSDFDLWGVKLSDIIPNLIDKRLKSYNSFRQVQRGFLKDVPDYQLATSINSIEILDSDNYMKSRLNMEFVLQNAKSGETILRHNVDREKDVRDFTIDTFVQNINDMILDETDNFIEKTYAYFAGDLPSEEAEAVEDDLPPVDFTLIDYFESYEDGAAEGSGLLFLPSLTQSENEEYFQIIDRAKNSIMGRFGEAIPLPKGFYTLRYGSGDESQRMTHENVEIIPRYRTIVEPDWGCLVVDIIDKNRNYAKVLYEIFSMETGESFGSEFPAEEEVGEQDKVWVLKPGNYKITINNEPFNTYSNFTTVQIDANSAKQMTIVVDTDDDGNPLDMVGAGVLEDVFASKDLSNISYTHAIHANLNFNSDNSLDKDEQIYNLIANIQYDNRFEYDNYPYHYTLKSLIEEGVSKSTDTDFRKSSDDIDLRNTFLYYFFANIGFYGRFDLNTHLMRDKVYLEEGEDFVKVSSDNELLEYKQFEDTALELEVKPPIFPFEMKQGLGVNYQVLKQSKANLSLRAGFGFRQEINNDVFNNTTLPYDEIDGIDISGAKQYIELENNTTEGTELSAVANFKLPIDLSYSTNAELLIPFDKEESVSAEWENSFDLRLFKYLSLNYKLKLRNRTSEQDEDYWLTQHSLFLRITYFLR
jgi:ABC-type uncharacterized transport system auxiliary subunit